jgi:AraC-like DNA-binding protein
MDPLSCLLDGSRARGAFVLRSSMTAPWSLRIEDKAPLTLVAVTRGAAWITMDSGEQHGMAAGEIALLRGPAPYLVSDEPDRPAQVVIDAAQNCHPAPGQRTNPMGPQGVRSWGNTADGETKMLTGTYRTHPELGRHLLAALPALLVLPGEDWTNPLVDYLVRESERDEPGQGAVLDRLLDLLLIALVRAWLARPEAVAPGWYAAQSDPVVGPALSLIHDRPNQEWSVASLGAAVGTSRASFARRFHDLVGESPINYLTSWRLRLAADLLIETDATLEAVAHQVGYSNAFALSTAFKRVHGISPRHYARGRARAAEALTAPG